MADRAEILRKIESFDSEVLVPAYREIQQTLRRHGDEAEVIPEYSRAAVEATAYMLHEMNAQYPGLALLIDDFPNDAEIAGGEEEYLGHSLYVVRGGAGSTGEYDGRFLVSNRFRLAPGDQVYASPHVIYYMAFNDRLHIFDHRYDASLADHRVEDVTREQVLDHFLDSYDFFKLHANDPEPPW